MCIHTHTGQFKIDKGSWNTVCQACDTCAAGGYRSGCGDSSTGKCTACAPGQFKAITGSWDSMCLQHNKCAKGSWTSIPGNSRSHPSCTKCEKGFYKATVSQSSTEIDSCIKCRAGRYTFNVGSAECEHCDDDSDMICHHIDSCANDPENDADSDNICGDQDSCPYDAANDIDSDLLCADVESCDHDAENDGNFAHLPLLHYRTRELTGLWLGNVSLMCTIDLLGQRVT